MKKTFIALLISLFIFVIGVACAGFIPGEESADKLTGCKASHQHSDDDENYQKFR